MKKNAVPILNNLLLQTFYVIRILNFPNIIKLCIYPNMFLLETKLFAISFVHAFYV